MEPSRLAGAAVRFFAVRPDLESRPVMRRPGGQCDPCLSVYWLSVCRGPETHCTRCGTREHSRDPEAPGRLLLALRTHDDSTFLWCPYQEHEQPGLRPGFSSPVLSAPRRQVHVSSSPHRARIAAASPQTCWPHPANTTAPMWPAWPAISCRHRQQTQTPQGGVYPAGWVTTCELSATRLARPTVRGGASSAGSAVRMSSCIACSSGPRLDTEFAHKRRACSTECLRAACRATGSVPCGTVPRPAPIAAPQWSAASRRGGARVRRGRARWNGAPRSRSLSAGLLAGRQPSRARGATAPHRCESWPPQWEAGWHPTRQLRPVQRKLWYWRRAGDRRFRCHQTQHLRSQDARLPSQARRKGISHAGVLDTRSS